MREIPDDVARLGPAFRAAAASAAGVTAPRLSRLVDAGLLERVARGLYLRTDADPVDLDLLEAATGSGCATICLTSALALHNLVDAIPSQLHVAMPRGTRLPAASPAIAWHHFDADTFEVGRTTTTVISAITIGVYSPERSIVDAYRLRHAEGVELAREALRSWLARGGTPSALLAIARQFHGAAPQIRDDLQVLL